MKRLKHEIKPYPKSARDYNTDVIRHDTYPPEESNEINFGKLFGSLKKYFVY